LRIISITEAEEIYNAVGIASLSEFPNTMGIFSGHEIEAYRYGFANGRSPQIVEATAQELASMNIASYGGSIGPENRPFTSIATTFPGLKVITCIYDEDSRGRVCSSCMIDISNANFGNMIESLAADGNGSLLCKYDGSLLWTYFETE
jgi:hypothetical protein